MADYEPRCPSCGKVGAEVVEVKNPDTLDLNAQAVLRCPTCLVRWEGLIPSPAYRAGREKGWFR